jgi:hypothetical protein
MRTTKTLSRWIKRAVIGGTAALLLGGGIGVVANAAGEVPVTARGATADEARIKVSEECARLGLEPVEDRPATVRDLPEGGVEATQECREPVGVGDGEGTPPGPPKPGDVSRLQASGATEQEALENGKKLCQEEGMDFGGQDGPADRFRENVVVFVKCIQRADTPRGRQP